MMEKKVLSVEELENQTAMELPDRHMMALITVQLLNGAKILVPVSVAANLCGISVAEILSQNITFCKQVAKA